MGGFSEHYGDHTILYPVTTLFVAVSVYGLTGRGLVMLASVVVGYLFLVVGLLIPDIDSTQSVIHRLFDRLLTAGIVGLIGYWVLVSDLGASVGLVVDPAVFLDGVPDRFVLVVLVLLLVVWWGYTTSHRGLPHRPRWAAMVAVLVGIGIWVGLPTWRITDRLAMGGSLALHFLVGYVAHLDRDGIVFGDGPSFRRTGGD